MTVALQFPSMVSALIPVDNAPADAALKSDFAKYVQGMKKILGARVAKQTEADDILKAYEEVSPPSVPGRTIAESLNARPCQLGNICSQTSSRIAKRRL